MRRIVGMMLVALVLLASQARAGEGPFSTDTPVPIGDQLIFYYDARADFTTFVNLRNMSGSEITVSILFYGPTFSTPFSRAVTLSAGALTILDVGGLRGSGLPAQPGVAIATVVNLSGQPITSNALTGNFTVANLLTGSAFGAAAAGRVAVDQDGKRLSESTVIDGNAARFQLIQPFSALLAAYYDPSSLAPVANSGNQLIFVNFEDSYAPTYAANIGSTTWTVTATRGNGAGIAETTFTANGVTVSDLASVVGPGVNGAAGSLVFEDEGEPTQVNRLIYFTESLGTFGTGYLLPLSFFP